MSIFKARTVPLESSASDASGNDELKAVTENLYKQNLDLAIRNKTLSLLRQLYQASILVLEPEELADRIARLVRETLEFELVAFFLLDENDRLLVPLKVNESERLLKVASKAGLPFRNTPIQEPEKSAFFSPLFAGQSNHTSDIEAVWGNTISAETLKAVRDQGHVRTTVAYPLVIGEKVTGALVICFNRPYDDLSEFEQESLLSLVNVSAIALDRSRLYQELRKLNSELTQVNKQQVVLIHFITHQIKGFVAKSRNIFSLLLEGDYGTLSDAMKPLVEEGFRSDTRGAQTIQEILNAANIKSGKVTYAKEPVDLNELTSGLITELKPAADAKGLALTYAPEGENLSISGDRMQLSNAVKNLIDNSIKYTPSGSVAVSLSREADTVRLCIKDTGVGITPEDMKNLFTEGGHGKESQKVNVESTGFGLYIVKNIIEAHNGKVWAESEGAGKGSRFIVELPVA